MSHELTQLNLRELLHRLESGATSAEHLAEVFCTHVRRHNPELNAIVRFDADDVLAQAREADQRRSQGEHAPLLGVPFTVKNTIWVGGRRATQGSRLFEDFVAPRDAVAVARLRAAGAIVLGASNCSEFACKGLTTNLLYGPTCNPWNPRLTPGGSSGGAATAVAAGFGPFALCTDGGGSTRRPAAHAGVVGYKPSAGLIPHPIGFQEPLFGNGVIGLMTRSIQDLELLLPVLCAPDAADPATPTAVNGCALLGAIAPTAQRVAYSPRFGLQVPVDDDVAASLDAVAESLSRQGLEVARRDPDWAEGSGEEALMSLQLAGLAALYGADFEREPGCFDPDIARQIEAGLALSGRAVAAALFARERMYRTLATFFDEFDAVLTPTTPCCAWEVDQLGPASIGGEPVSPRAHAVFTPIVNHTYLPAMSVPCGLSSQGLPIGAQVISPRFHDRLVLALARHIEQSSQPSFARPHLPAAGAE